MKAVTLAKWESKVRPFITGLLPTHFVIDQYSRRRLRFLERLKKEATEIKPVKVPTELERMLWGLKFNSSLMNAAGIDKNGELYNLCARQGAGGYIAGTTTFNFRKGNEKEGIHLPFVPLPKSRTALNFLGLPNKGDEAVAERLASIEHTEGCPLGVSVMESPDFQGEEKLELLVQGMKLYEKAGVDFIELNVSCPNTSERPFMGDTLHKTLRYIKEHFLDGRSLNGRSRTVPVVVKFSNDTYLFEVKTLMDQLFQFCFDVVNFGNTSKQYKDLKDKIDVRERRLFDYFTNKFGGGISGEPLRNHSLALCNEAISYLRVGPPPQEFHVIRTGGIASAEDLITSDRVGVSLNQWFTGYFERFAQQGHRVYASIYQDYIFKKRLS